MKQEYSCQWQVFDVGEACQFQGLKREVLDLAAEAFDVKVCVL